MQMSQMYVCYQGSEQGSSSKHTYVSKVHLHKPYILKMITKCLFNMRQEHFLKELQMSTSQHEQTSEWVM